MQTRVKNHVDKLFSGIYETRELNELKEEIGLNLLERIEDFIGSGSNEDDAFSRAISDLGDMSELVEGLKRASQGKVEVYRRQPIGKKHVIGYMIASVILLLGMMISGITYLNTKHMLNTLWILTPFLVISAGLYVYLGLTQETKQHYGMRSRRALGYSLTTGVSLLGLMIAGLAYFTGTDLIKILLTSMIFVIPSVMAYIYLGLTEKSRIKIDWKEQWMEQWIDHYSNPKTMMIYGNIIGALWIFAIGAIILIGIKISWKYAWIPFVLAVGIQLIVDAILALRKK